MFKNKNRNKKNYSKIAIFTLVIISIVSVSIYLIFPNTASAAWFNDSYAYRKYTSFTHNASLTNRRVSVSVDTATLITAGKMQSDCDDTRFTDGSGKVLRYQLTGVCNNAATTYDVLIPTVINGLNAIYIYYGNPLATTGSTDISSFTSLSPSGGAASLASEEKGSQPVLYWSFNDGNGTTAQDTSQNNNDATLTNGPVWQPDDMCVSSKCLKFDGSNDRAGKTYSSDTELDPGTASFTISTWVRHVSAISGTDTILSRVDGGVVNGVGYKLYMNSSGNICFGVDASAGSFPSDSACSTAAFNDSQWHFVQAVKNGTTDITLYIDGNQVGQDASITASSISGSSAPIYAGIDGDTTSNPWDGFIDEVKIYNYAKSTAQLKADNANLGGADSTGASFGATTPNVNLSNGLAGYWKMDESAANSCTGGTNDSCDSSGNGIDGAWINNTTTSTTAKFNRSLVFDGTDDYVDLNDNIDINASESLTISLWVYRTNVSSDMILVSKKLAANSGSGYQIEQYSAANGGNTCMYISDGTNQYENCTADHSTETLNTWEHLVFVFDRASGKKGSTIFRNGIVDKATVYEVGDPKSVGDTSNVNGLCLGIQAQVSGDCQTTFDFAGRLDEVRIYKRALAQQEVISLYEYSPAPIGYWKLDEGSGTSTLDSSTTGSTGTLNTGPTWTSGKYGRSVNFDATDDDITVSSGTTYDLTNSMTLSAWIYPTSYGEGLGYGSIFAFRVDDGNVYEFQTINDAAGAHTAGLVLYNVVGGAADIIDAGTGNIIALNTWQHVAVSVINNVAYFYVNGRVINPSGTSLTLNSKGSGTAYIGSFDGNQDTFGGRIDEVRVYNYGRNSKQILQDMNVGHPTVGTPVSSTVGHWSFDEGYGTTAHDKSPNTNDLTLSTATGSWTNDGKFNKAWLSTGANYLSRADDSDFDFIGDDDMTISLWTKLACNATDTQTLLNKGVDSGYTIIVFPNDGSGTSGTVNFLLGDTLANADGVSSTTNICDSNWHHIVATKTGMSRIALYIDGRLEGSYTSMTTDILSNPDPLYIGDSNGVNDGDELVSGGEIDELKIYRASLTADEVKVEYNQGKAQVLGAISTESDGITASNSNAREYCVPGDTTSCSSPKAEWKFDEGTGTSANDISGNLNTGTLTNTPLWRPGKIGKALDFTSASSQYVAVTDSSSLDNSAAMTIDVWIKPTSNSLNGFYHNILGKGGSGNYDYGLATVNSTTISFFWGTAGVFDDWQTSGTTILTADQWTHIVATRNSALNTVYIYVNGTRYSTTNTGAGAAPGGGAYNLSIGRPGDDNLEYFDGQIDNLRLYNYAFTQPQVSWSYNRGAPVAHYKLNECSGTVINDSSGNSITGTLTIGGSGTYTSAGACSSGTSSQSWNGGTTGKYSSSAAFDGTDDYITTATNSKLQGGTNVTLSAWVNAAALSANHCPVGLFGSSSDKGYWFNIPSTGEPQFYISRDGSAQDSVTGSPGQITTGTWAHMVGTYDGTTMKIYLNGRLLNSTTQVGTIHTVSTSNAFAIGRLGATSADYFNGQVDDVRVYNYVATPAQVKTIYNEGAAVRFGPQTGSP